MAKFDPDAPRCDRTGKRIFTSKERARAALSRMRGGASDMRCYRCDDGRDDRGGSGCGGWHLAHKYGR